MKITYDSEANALYIQFKEGTVTTKKVADGIAVDFDRQGKLAGIEILDAKTRFADVSTLRKITLEEIGLTHPKS